jgi:hypothetical protein
MYSEIEYEKRERELKEIKKKKKKNAPYSEKKVYLN